MLDKRLTEETLVNIVLRCTLHDITCELKQGQIPEQGQIPVFSFLAHEEKTFEDIKELFHRLNVHLDEKIQFATRPSKKDSSTKLFALYGVNNRNLSQMLNLSYGMSHEPTEWHRFMEKPYSAQLESELESFFTETKANANGLAIDPNQVWFCENSVASQFSKWGNTALHHGLSYENFPVIECFLSIAKDKVMDIDLGSTDSGGKTPLLLAIKVFAPERLVKQLMTDENYNMADHDGMTPMMLACALRRTDVIELLIKQDAKVKGYGPIEFKAITAKQKMQMSSFINQIHEESGKSLGHFAVLRAGTIHDQKGENIAPLMAPLFKSSEMESQKKKIRLAKQGCVLNLLKDAGMDGFRDERAQWNCITNKRRDPISTVGELIPSGQLCFISEHAKRDDGGKVYLNSKENVDRCLQRLSSSLKQPDISDLYQHLKSLGLSGISLVEGIMSRSGRALTLLKDCGLNLEIQQHAGAKNVHAFVEGLKEHAAAVNLISEHDKRYLFSLPQELLIHAQVDAHSWAAASSTNVDVHVSGSSAFLIEAPVEAYASVSESGLFAASSEPSSAAGALKAVLSESAGGVAGRFFSSASPSDNASAARAAP